MLIQSLRLRNSFVGFVDSTNAWKLCNSPSDTLNVKRPNKASAIPAISQRISCSRSHRSSFPLPVSKSVRAQKQLDTMYIPKNNVSQKFPESCAAVIENWGEDMLKNRDVTPLEGWEDKVIRPRVPRCSGEKSFCHVYSCANDRYAEAVYDSLGCGPRCSSHDMGKCG